MDLLDELGLRGTEKLVFCTVEEKRSYRLAAESLGLTEGRTKHLFFSACEKLSEDSRGRPRVEAILQSIPPPPSDSSAGS